MNVINMEFTMIEGAERARRAVAGRSFSGKIVTAVPYPEELFSKKVILYLKLLFIINIFNEFKILLGLCYSIRAFG